MHSAGCPRLYYERLRFCRLSVICRAVTFAAGVTFLSFFETLIDPRLQGKYKMGGQLKELLSGSRRFGKRVPKKNNQRHMALLHELLAVAHP